MYRNFPDLVGTYLANTLGTARVFDSALMSGSEVISGRKLLDNHLNPMVDAIYKDIATAVNVDKLDANQATLFIGELSVFARFNSTFLLRAADTVRSFCPELAQEFMRNYLEEAGEVGKFPAHYLVFSGALLSDLGLRVNGWSPRAMSTLALTSIIDILSWSHCHSTILGMYYGTEAVATPETRLLQQLTDRVRLLTDAKNGSKLDYYYRMHLDSEHEAATLGRAVEQGHQEGIAHFIENHDRFGFHQAQIIDGFLQVLQLFVDQWMEVNELCKRESEAKPGQG